MPAIAFNRGARTRIRQSHLIFRRKTLVIWDCFVLWMHSVHGLELRYQRGISPLLVCFALFDLLCSTSFFSCCVASFAYASLAWLVLYSDIIMCLFCIPKPGESRLNFYLFSQRFFFARIFLCSFHSLWLLIRCACVACVTLKFISLCLRTLKFWC